MQSKNNSGTTMAHTIARLIARMRQWFKNPPGTSRTTMAFLIGIALISTIIWTDIFAIGIIIKTIVKEESLLILISVFPQTYTVWLPAVACAVSLARAQPNSHLWKAIAIGELFFLAALLFLQFPFCANLTCLPLGLDRFLYIVKPEGNLLPTAVYRILAQAIMMPIICGTVYMFHQQWTAAKVRCIIKIIVINTLLAYAILAALIRDPLWIFSVYDGVRIGVYWLFFAGIVAAYAERPAHIRRKLLILIGISGAIFMYGALNIIGYKHSSNSLIGPIQSLGICIMAIVVMILFFMSEILRRLFIRAEVHRTSAS